MVLVDLVQRQVAATLISDHAQLDAGEDRQKHFNFGKHKIRTLETSSARDGIDSFSAGRWVKLDS